MADDDFVAREFAAVLICASVSENEDIRRSFIKLMKDSFDNKEIVEIIQKQIDVATFMGRRYSNGWRAEAAVFHIFCNTFWQYGKDDLQLRGDFEALHSFLILNDEFDNIDVYTEVLRKRGDEIDWKTSKVLDARALLFGE